MQIETDKSVLKMAITISSLQTLAWCQSLFHFSEMNFMFSLFSYCKPGQFYSQSSPLTALTLPPVFLHNTATMHPVSAWLLVCKSKPFTKRRKQKENMVYPLIVSQMQSGQWLQKQTICDSIWKGSTKSLVIRLGLYFYFKYILQNIPSTAYNNYVNNNCKTHKLGSTITKITFCWRTNVILQYLKYRHACLFY